MGKRTKKTISAFVVKALCFLVLFSACGSYPKKQNFKESNSDTLEILNPYFSNSEKDYVYKADITIFKNSFSGIFIVKKLGPQQHRIVFTTELGNKILDFEFFEKTFKINHILPEMDKKALKNILKRDFLALIEERQFSEKTYSNGNLSMGKTRSQSKNHYYLFENRILKKIVQADHGKAKTTFIFSGINDNIASNIAIEHHNFKMKINLKKI